MRYTRLKKFGKKNRVLWISIKLFGVWYLLIGGYAAIAGQTNAYFTDSEAITGEMKAGIWQSALKIDKTSIQDGNISASITNVGADMESLGQYEVYYIETGDPQSGLEVSNGTFQKLKTNDFAELKFSPQANGFYKFKVYLENEEGNAVWSDSIEVVTIETEELPEENPENAKENEQPAVTDPTDESQESENNNSEENKVTTPNEQTNGEEPVETEVKESDTTEESEEATKSENEQTKQNTETAAEQQEQSSEQTSTPGESENLTEQEGK
ncbi:MAG: amyloid fiber anchoring/assembly protein TapA [Bacillota bacterium]